MVRCKRASAIDESQRDVYRAAAPCALERHLRSAIRAGRCGVHGQLPRRRRSRFRPSYRARRRECRRYLGRLARWRSYARMAARHPGLCHVGIQRHCGPCVQHADRSGTGRYRYAGGALLAGVRRKRQAASAGPLPARPPLGAAHRYRSALARRDLRSRGHGQGPRGSGATLGAGNHRGLPGDHAGLLAGRDHAPRDRNDSSTVRRAGDFRPA